MSRSSDQYDAQKYYIKEICCSECGFHRNGQHHPKIRCPKTNRCGTCGSPWVCIDHDTKHHEKRKS